MRISDWSSDVCSSDLYRVSNVEEYVFQIVDPDLTLKQATKAAVRQVVGQSKMDFILTDGREEVADETKRVLQELLDQYKAGLELGRASGRERVGQDW